jgi:mono/diheme cytochrome c family protein
MISGRKQAIIRIFAALAASSIAAAHAEPLGDADRGHLLAKQVCAECHAVEKNETVSRNTAAPTFSAIAQSPGMTSLALSVFFRTPHENMPNLVLPTQQMLDVIAYIESLKRPAAER